MANLEESCLILELALALKLNGSWAGETHVQKASYFLNELLHVPTNLEFILYKHGPFSFDLRELLTDMEANGFIRWIPQPPYGPSIGEGALGPILRAKFSTLSVQYERQVNFVARHLGSCNVASLERLATALYVDSEGYTGAARVGRIVELKPHVDSSLAEQAVEELEKIRDSAKTENLIFSIGTQASPAY
jgi:hypothetical protein